MVTPISRVVPGTLGEIIHGGADPGELRRLGLSPEQVLDFSANLNPFGPSPAVCLTVAGAAIDCYPDRACRELRLELARRHGVAMEQVLVGNGSSELIWLAAVGYLAAGDGVLILGPAFGEYERCARLMGARVTTCRATSDGSFRPPFAAFAREVNELRPKLAFVASPNNPTGQSIALSELFALAARHPQTLFVLDEAYVDCAESPPQYTPEPPPNVLRLRSLTKMHGLAGLRLGYAVGSRDVILALHAAQPSWSVNALAQAAGLAALRDDGYLRDCRTRWTEAKGELIEQLQHAGFAPVRSAVPFFLLPVGDAARFRVLLIRQGILVRDCTSFGLPEFIRISSRGKEENSRLVEALLQTRAEVATCRS